VRSLNQRQSYIRTESVTLLWIRIRYADGIGGFLSNGDVFFQLDRIALLESLSQDIQASERCPIDTSTRKMRGQWDMQWAGSCWEAYLKAHSIVLLDNADIRCPRTV